ncbi:hypothetical protein FOZ60_014349 [Perkinsus olseni]|uniref:Integrase catalytic domain-containing protein n=1 Tax=Perkinsus olseni TaxID=32597 RepID=A0A7J6P787_PEROL|nr:hypothetical protein FOZ60_014349 [Perkinsus olseni]
MNAIKTSTVIYDYKDCDLLDDPPASSSTLDLPPEEHRLCTITVNPDGIPLPKISDIEDPEQHAELDRILRYAKQQYTSDQDSPLDTIEFVDAIETCAHRCQHLDEDLRLLKSYLEGKGNKNKMGVKATYITRLATICILDDHGLIRRYPQQSEWKRAFEDPLGVIFLGGSDYAKKLITLLAIIYHYVYLHKAHRKITAQLQRRYNGKGLPTIVKKTIASCLPCLRSKAYRGLNYVSRSVQALATKSIWQVCGADIVGPYQRDEPIEGSTTSSPRKRYILLVHDAITSFTCARILSDASALSVSDAFHSIWCEMGAPSVLVTDKDMSAFINRQVKKNLISHGVRHLVLPPYSPHLSFWERIHRDYVQMSRSINSQVNSENDYIRSYLLAIRAHNCTAKGWIPFTPASLHFTYHQRLPGDPPASSDIINYDALSAGTIDTDNFGFARAMLPFVKDIQDDVASSINEYIEYWYHKQAEYRKKINLSTEKTYPDPKPFDIVFVTNQSDIGWTIGNKMKSSIMAPDLLAIADSNDCIYPTSRSGSVNDLTFNPQGLDNYRALCWSYHLFLPTVDHPPVSPDVITKYKSLAEEGTSTWCPLSDDHVEPVSPSYPDRVVNITPEIYTDFEIALSNLKVSKPGSICPGVWANLSPIYRQFILTGETASLLSLQGPITTTRLADLDLISVPRISTLGIFLRYISVLSIEISAGHINYDKDHQRIIGITPLTGFDLPQIQKSSTVIIPLPRDLYEALIKQNYIAKMTLFNGVISDGSDAGIRDIIYRAGPISRDLILRNVAYIGHLSTSSADLQVIDKLIRGMSAYQTVEDGISLETNQEDPTES